MADAKRDRSIVTITATASSGKPQVVHMVCVGRPEITVGGSSGGYRCVELVKLKKPAPCGGNTVAVVMSDRDGQETIKRHIVKEKPEEILAAFKKAEAEHRLPADQIPKIGEQTLAWKAIRLWQRVARPNHTKGDYPSAAMS